MDLQPARRWRTWPPRFRPSALRPAFARIDEELALCEFDFLQQPCSVSLKSTSVRITRWEYSDPIGVPHPNIVTLVVQVPRRDAAKVEVRTQWLGKTWSQKSLRAKTPPLVIEGTQQILRYDIPVDAYINAHGPKRLRSSIYLGGMKVKDVDLPIQLGD